MIEIDTSHFKPDKNPSKDNTLYLYLEFTGLISLATNLLQLNDSLEKNVPEIHKTNLDTELKIWEILGNEDDNEHAISFGDKEIPIKKDDAKNIHARLSELSDTYLASEISTTMYGFYAGTILLGYAAMDHYLNSILGRLVALAPHNCARAHSNISIKLSDILKEEGPSLEQDVLDLWLSHVRIFSIEKRAAIINRHFLANYINKTNQIKFAEWCREMSQTRHDLAHGRHPILSRDICNEYLSNIKEHRFGICLAVCAEYEDS